MTCMSFCLIIVQVLWLKINTVHVLNRKLLVCFLLWKILLGLELSALCDSSYKSFFLDWGCVLFVIPHIKVSSLDWSYLLFVIPHIKVSSWTGVVCSLWFLIWKFLLGLELSPLCDSSYKSFFLDWSYLLFIIPHIKVSSWTGVVCSLWFLT